MALAWRGRGSKELRAQLSEQGPQAHGLLRFVGSLMQQQQHERDKRDQDLRFDGVFAPAQAVANAQVLLDPFEEQPNLPARLVELRDLQRRGVHVLGGQHPRAMRRSTLARACSGTVISGSTTSAALPRKRVTKHAPCVSMQCPRL